MCIRISIFRPEEGEKPLDRINLGLEYLLTDLVFLAIVGIDDPLRPGVPDAVSSCQQAGITVRMVTGDNVRTAKAIAMQSGILGVGGDDIIMGGAEFRSLSDAELDQKLPHLKVVALSSPSPAAGTLGGRFSDQHYGLIVHHHVGHILLPAEQPPRARKCAPSCC